MLDRLVSDRLVRELQEECERDGGHDDQREQEEVWEEYKSVEDTQRRYNFYLREKYHA